MPTYIAIALLDLAKTEFRRLWKRHKEDVIQHLHLVQLINGPDPGSARHFLAWLEYELGVANVPPPYDKPPDYPGPVEVPSRERAIENQYVLGVLASERLRRFGRVRAA